MRKLIRPFSYKRQAPPSPDFPFQIIVCDYFSLQDHNFLVIADRFTGWNSVIPTPPGKFDGQHLITDGGPQMMSGVFQKWLKEWDIQHQPSRAYFPHSNSRAETAVNSSKTALPSPETLTMTSS